jgi:hypothetical protein
MVTSLASSTAVGLRVVLVGSTPAKFRTSTGLFVSKLSQRDLI